jgi:thiamine transporter
MTSNTIMHTKIGILAECALLIAAACVLSFLKIKPVPFGGSITIGSMVPIVLISYRRGLKWGFLSAFIFGIFRVIIGFSGAGTMSFFTTLLSIFFDYIAAFTVLGIAGIFKGKMKRPANEFALGVLVAVLLRYLCHILSGYLFFSEWAEWFFGEAGALGTAVLTRFSGAGLSLIYSIIYNATFMLPEMVVTIAACYLLSLKSSLIDPDKIGDTAA